MVEKNTFFLPEFTVVEEAVDIFCYLKKSAQQQKEIPSIEIAIFVHDVCHDK